MDSRPIVLKSKGGCGSLANHRPYPKTTRRPAARWASHWLGIAVLGALCSCGPSADVPPEPSVPEISLRSPAFEPDGPIPSRFSCEGDDHSPPLSWDDPPEQTQSFALTCIDPDAPIGSFDHWMMGNIPADLRGLPEAVPTDEVITSLPDVDADLQINQGVNDFGNVGYGGPCPPEGQTHRYVFRLYALDVSAIDLPEEFTSADLHQALEGHIVGFGKLVGTYRQSEGE